MSQKSNENKNCYDFLLDECIKTKNKPNDCKKENDNLLVFVTDTKNKINKKDIHNVELKPYDNDLKYNSKKYSQQENMSNMKKYLSQSYNLDSKNRTKSLKINSSSKKTSTKLDTMPCFNEIMSECYEKKDENECDEYIRNHFKKYYTNGENNDLYEDERLQIEKVSKMDAFIIEIYKSIDKSIINIMETIKYKNDLKNKFLIDKNNIENIFYKDSSDENIVYYPITNIIQKNDENNYYLITSDSITNPKTTFINDLEITENKSSKIDNNDYILGEFNKSWYKGKVIKTNDKNIIQYDDGEIVEISSDNKNIKLINKTLLNKIDNLIKPQILNLIKLLLKVLNTILINTKHKSFTTLEQINKDKQNYIDNYIDFNQYDIAFYNIFINRLTTILKLFEEKKLDNIIKEYIGNFKYIYTYLEKLKLIGRYEATEKYNNEFINELSKFTNIPKEESKKNTKKTETEYLKLLIQAMTEDTKKNITVSNFINGKGGKSRKNNKRKTQKKKNKK